MAVSATVSPGKIFSSEEVISISELNKLGTPTVDISGAVGSLSISANSLNNSHMQAAAAIQLDKLASGTSAQVVVASSTGVPTYVALSGDATISNAGALTLAADSVVTVDILDLNVTTGKLADDAVTAGKMDDLLTDSGGTAGSYTAADITVDSTGRVSAVASGAASHPTARITSFTADGTWTAPSGVTRAKFTIVGGGGSGCSTLLLSGGGGGTAIISAAVTAATGYAITVGTGVSQASSTSGSTGVDSTVVVGATTYTGAGGAGASSGAGGAGGTATNGDVNIQGGQGRSSGQGNEGGAGAGNSYHGGIGEGSVGSATSSDGIVIVEWVE
jgi:hypothetical protein